MSGSVAIVTGHRVDGPTADLERLAASVDTLVVLMPAHLDAIAQRLSSALGSDRPAALISRATTPQQQVVRATLGSIVAAAREARVEPPSTLVVGAVVNVLDVAGATAGDRAAVATAP